VVVGALLAGTAVAFFVSQGWNSLSSAAASAVERERKVDVVEEVKEFPSLEEIQKTIGAPPSLRRKPSLF